MQNVLGFKPISNLVMLTDQRFKTPVTNVSNQQQERTAALVLSYPWHRFQSLNVQQFSDRQANTYQLYTTD